jgi:DNA-directed RNA polymerase II subunit RPB1
MADFVSTSYIDHVVFYPLGSEEIKKRSNVMITNKDTFKGDLPIEHGVYDSRLGTTDYSFRCGTCFNQKNECPGHEGSLELRYPVKSPLFRNILFKWLKIICFSCGKPILKKTVSGIARDQVFTYYIKQSSKLTKCQHCGAFHPKITKKKSEPFTFLIAKTDVGTDEKEKEKGEDLTEELFNHEILQIMERVDNSTVKLLGRNLLTHPKKYVLSTISITPTPIRPDVKRAGSSRNVNSDLTILTKYVVECNNQLKESIPVDKKDITRDMRNKYAALDFYYNELVKGSNGSTGQISLRSSTSRACASIASRWPKKTGRLRKNLMGKRCRYMARSVLIGDAMLNIDEVGIPMQIATAITIPEVVCEFNRTKLLVYFLNKSTYPGCTHIKKASNNSLYKVEYMDPKYQLQIGDTIYRHVIDGDIVNFNRQPSVLNSNIFGVRIKILNHSALSKYAAGSLKDVKALRINVSNSKLANFDFDGDAVNAIFATSRVARLELEHLSHMKRFIVSDQKKSPVVGALQDFVSGASMLTESGILFDRLHAMEILATCQFHSSLKDWSLTKDFYTGKELFSMILPSITIKGKKPTFYMKQFASEKLNIINYDKDDMSVLIEHGNLLSGTIDKATIGQGSNGSIIQVVNNDYSSEAAINVLYNIQQLVNQFLISKGFTVGIKDIALSDDTMKKIKVYNAGLIRDANEVIEKLDKGELIPPLGISFDDFIELEQCNALEPGDGFTIPIIANSNIKKNFLARMIFSGAKGSKQNFININGASGSQIIAGKRPVRNFGWERTSPYFTRYDMSPEANGYVSSSFVEGLTPEIMSFIAADSRFGTISGALSTSISGYQNRLSIKNLESIIADILHRSVKDDNIIQFLYAETAFDPAKLEQLKFLTMMCSKDEMEKNFHTSFDDINIIYHNDTVKKVLNDEFDQIIADRVLLRKIFISYEIINQGKSIANEESTLFPINIERIINSINVDKEKTSNSFDPVKAINSVKELINDLPFIYFHPQVKKKYKAPRHVEKALTFIKIAIRSYLSTKKLITNRVSNTTLNKIIDKIKNILSRVLIDPGRAIGILAAESISEHATQYVLDSKHRAGGGGSTKTETLVRIREILNTYPTNKMKNPSMLIHLKPEYETKKEEVEKIAKHFEELQFSKYTILTQVFYEEFEHPVHSKYKHESGMIKKFMEYMTIAFPPSDLINWCIRFELNREEMIFDSMDLETIVNSLKDKEPNIFIVHSSENTEGNIILRCYFRISAFKKNSQINDQEIITKVADLKKIVLRGISGIKSAYVIDNVKSVIDPETDKMIIKKTYVIETSGSNLEEILLDSRVDQYRTQTDSIVEMENMFGIEYARNKIITELCKNIPSVYYDHMTVMADEMAFLGKITAIQKSGLQAREKNNICLQLSFQFPIQVIENAAVNVVKDQITGISGPLVLGQMPKIGTFYNSIIINQDFIKENEKNLKKEIDAL